MKNRILFAASIVLTALFILAVCYGNINKSPTPPQKCYKVLLDGQAWFYIQDKAKLEDLLDGYKKQYTDKVDKNAKITSINFKQKLEIIEDIQHFTNTITLEQAKEKIYARTKKASYTVVKSGDNIGAIAENNNTSVEELQNLNPQLDSEMRIYPGDSLCISPEKPVLDVIITCENTVVEDIPFNTEYIKDANLYESQKQLISEGVTGKQELSYRIVLTNGNVSEQKVINSKIIKPSVASKVRIGTKRLVVSRSGGTLRVVSSGRVTSSFGTRIHPLTGEKIFHKGIDIGSSMGNPVYAYGSGTVIYAGWKSGYGNFVAIDHGNGLVTRYGHMSALYVQDGQHVNGGQRIAAVGSTGDSTGPHLHFEVLVDGEYKNPQNYL